MTETRGTGPEEIRVGFGTGGHAGDLPEWARLTPSGGVWAGRAGECQAPFLQV